MHNSSTNHGGSFIADLVYPRQGGLMIAQSLQTIEYSYKIRMIHEDKECMNPLRTTKSLLSISKDLCAHRLIWIILIGCLFFFLQPTAHAEASEIVVDSIVASVNNKPITLREVCERLSPTRELTLDEASDDPEVLYTLDVLILEELIRQESQTRKISVGTHEIEAYIDEVATRNSLSREAFEQALEEEGKSLQEYKNKIEIDILKSKLASNIVKSGSGITNSEIETYIAEHPELSKSGAKIKLAQIFVSLAGRSEEDARKMISLVREKFEDGEDFSALAKQYSESAEGAQGGTLGVMAEEDLSRSIFDAVFALDEGDVSEVVQTGAGLHLFLVEKRYVEKNSGDSKIRDEVREILEKQKLQTRMQTFFTTDLFKQHSIDKKL
jgi:peptidyl-prolyl cis-trans isomerase SurA